MKTSPPKVAQPYFNIHSLCTQRCVHNADNEYHTIRPTRRWNTLAAKRGLINKAHRVHSKVIRALHILYIGAGLARLGIYKTVACHKWSGEEDIY